MNKRLAGYRVANHLEGIRSGIEFCKDYKAGSSLLFLVYF